MPGDINLQAATTETIKFMKMKFGHLPEPKSVLLDSANAGASSGFASTNDLANERKSYVRMYGILNRLQQSGESSLFISEHTYLVDFVQSQFKQKQTAILCRDKQTPVYEEVAELLNYLSISAPETQIARARGRG